MLKLYNTFSNKEEEFIPTKEGEARVYTCGPTVYGRQHIGNYSSFLMADLLVRVLELNGYKVTHAKNITDVGHLVADDSADASGEDKIEKQARAESIDPLEVAKKYAEQYIADEVLLNMREPEYRPRATEYITAMLHLTKELLAKGIAYETDDGYYFNVEQFEAYGELSGNTLDNVQAGARVDINTQKKHSADFALWKKCVGENAHHLLRWSFESGERVAGDTEDATVGFPGWHIECSAMSKQCLEYIDIHTGGEDNIFPHHECEIAQSECVYGKPFSKYWLHRRRIDLGNTKMSKSLGNTINLDDIQAMGFSVLDLRYYLLSVHYRTQLKFTKEGLAGAAKARKKIERWINQQGIMVEALDVPNSGRNVFDIAKYKTFRATFIQALNDDLNTPAALAAVFECIAYTNRSLLVVDNSEFTKEAALFIKAVQDVFACFEVNKDTDTKVPAEVTELLNQRQAAREAKNFELSDTLRENMNELGWNVKDTSRGQELERL